LTSSKSCSLSRTFTWTDLLAGSGIHTFLHLIRLVTMIQLLRLVWRRPAFVGRTPYPNRVPRAEARRPAATYDPLRRARRMSVNKRTCRGPARYVEYLEAGGKTVQHLRYGIHRQARRR
jgi:hypothetical protein